MKHLFQVIVGVERERDGFAISDEIRAARTAALLHDAAKRFGGATIHNARGSWTDQKGNVQYERSLVVQVVTDREHAVVAAFARYTGRAFNQREVILISPDNIAATIPAS